MSCLVWTACGDSIVRAFDAKSGSLKRQFVGHEAAVNCMTIAGGKLYTGSSDGTLRIWDAKDVSEDLMVDDGPPPPIPTPGWVSLGGWGQIRPDQIADRSHITQISPLFPNDHQSSNNPGHVAMWSACHHQRYGARHSWNNYISHLPSPPPLYSPLSHFIWLLCWANIVFSASRYLFVKLRFFLSPFVSLGFQR